MINLYNNDCFNIMSNVASNSVDLIITDPPYKIGYKDWDRGEFINFTIKWVDECIRILKSEGTMWSFMGYQNICDFITILAQRGNLHLENWVVWARQKGRGSSKHLKSQREDILHFAKSNKFTWDNIKMLREVVCPYMKDGKPRGWFLDENGKRVRWTGLGNVWVYTAPQYNSILDKQVHPAQKPTMLMERLILLSSNKNDIVFDPFMGSGTTGVACKNLNRNFIGIEIDKAFFNIAENRMNCITNYFAK